MKRLVIALLVLIGYAAAVPADTIEVITLRHRPAEELIPVIKPMLDAGGSMSGQGFQLIVRSNDANLEQIRHLVQTLDTAPQQLLISVFQGSDSDVRALSMSGSLEYEDDRVRGSIGDTSGRSNGGSVRYSTDGATVSGRVHSTRERLSDNPVHRLRVTAGTAGYVDTGQSVPFFSGRVWQGPGGTTVESGVEYKDVTTGFYVLPRVTGDQVIVEISPYKNALSRSHGGAIDTQSATTTVTGPLGQWLQIGGVTEQFERSQSGTGSIASTRGRSNASIWIKAEQLD